MTSSKSGPIYRVRPGLLAGVVLCALSFAGAVHAQSGGTIEVGTTITVRTNEQINVGNSDGRVFSGVVEQDVVNSNGNVAIPRGANVELLVKAIAKNEIALDLESVTVNGQRYAIQAQDTVFGSQQADGLGANRRTGEFLGTGAAIGAIIGAIAGGGKGAAIGGGAGAATGAGAQLLTRGKNVNVPAESLVTFRLLQPLQTGGFDSGFSRNGQHYHPGYSTKSTNSAAYQDGLQAGRSDSNRSLDRNLQSTRWRNGQPVRDYQAGYNVGYDGVSSGFQETTGQVRIGLDNRITWQGPPNSHVYVQVDSKRRQLFATGRSGVQPAPWMISGHQYLFILQNENGSEIARDQLDLRQRRY